MVKSSEIYIFDTSFHKISSFRRKVSNARKKKKEQEKERAKRKKNDAHRLVGPDHLVVIETDKRLAFKSSCNTL